MVVLEKYKGFGSYVTCSLAMTGSKDVRLLAFAVTVAIRVGKESEPIFGLQDATAGDVDVSLAHLAFLDALFQESHEALRAHVHIGSGQKRLLGGFLEVAGCAVLQNLADRAIVGHHEALEVPLLAQHVGHHPVACRGRHIVDEVERRHDASHTSVDHSLIGRQKLVVHAYLAHVGGVVLLACLNGSIEGEMLETSHDVVFGDDGLTAHVSLLIAASHGCSQDTTEVWVLAEAFADASPAGIESHVDHRREGPVDAVGACLACRNGSHLLQSFFAPRA